MTPLATLAGMRTRTAKLLALGIATFALGAGGSLAAAAAPAGAHYLKSTNAAADHHLNILRFPPRNPRFRPCIKRTVGLRSGDFLHSAYIVSETHRTDPDLSSQAPIHIAVPGVYRWEACRGWNSRIERYEVRSTLRGHGFSHTNKNVFARDPNVLGPSHLYGNGNYEWGGRIVRRQDDVTVPSG
jgi:hypothetical protein